MRTPEDVSANRLRTAVASVKALGPLWLFFHRTQRCCALPHSPGLGRHNPAPILFCLFLLPLYLAPRAAISDDPFKALGKVPSYFDLTAVPGLETYRVQVEGRGEIWQEIARTLGEDQVRLTEYFRAPDEVSLHLEGKGDAARFIPGLFDPNRAVRFLIDELESFREKKTLAQLREKGRVQSSYGAGRRTIEIMPRRSTVLLEQFNESGTEASLVRIYRIKAELDSASGRILRFDVEKETRARRIGSPWKSDTLRHGLRFDFGYEISKSLWLPKELVVWRDGQKEMRFSVEYGRVQGWDLPKVKQVEYRMEGRWESASLIYREYVVNRPLPDSLFADQGVTDSQHGLQRAGRLAQMAENALNQGKIGEARRRMEALIKQYPGTPQAKQAMIFLGEFGAQAVDSSAVTRKKLP